MDPNQSPVANSNPQTSDFNPTPPPPPAPENPDVNDLDLDNQEPQSSDIDFLTDPVMPEEIPTDMAPTFDLADPTPAPPPPPPPQTSYLPPQADTAKPQPVPATLPASIPSSPPTNLIIVGVVAVMIVIVSATAAFFYIQSSRLKSQLNAINTTVEQRGTNPTPTVSLEATPTTEPTTETITPTVTTPAAGSQQAFAALDKIFTQAQSESETAQLLMITNNNILDSASSYRYWFRRQPNVRKYFLIEKSPTADAKLFSEANVTPDNNIPDLNTQYSGKTLGIDAANAYSLAFDKVVSNYAKGVVPAVVTAKYLNTSPTGTGGNTNLWQLVFKFPQSSGLADGVVQIDAIKSEVVFTNLPQ